MKNVFWELPFILNHNTKTENYIMKLGGSIFKNDNSEYFLMTPIIGLHDLLSKEALKEKNIIVRGKKKLYIYRKSTNSRLINVTAKNLFCKRC